MQTFWRYSELTRSHYFTTWRPLSLLELNKEREANVFLEAFQLEAYTHFSRVKVIKVVYVCKNYLQSFIEQGIQSKNAFCVNLINPVLQETYV